MANNNQRKLPKFNIFWMYGLIILALLMFYYWQNNEVSQPVSWTQFESWVQKGGVTSITVYTNKNTAEAVLSDSLAKEMFKGKQYAPTPGTPTKMVTHIPSSDKFDEKVEQWRQKGVFKGDVKYDQASDFSMAFFAVWPRGRLLTAMVRHVSGFARPWM